jgi:hypothetical protein
MLSADVMKALFVIIDMLKKFTVKPPAAVLKLVVPSGVPSSL